MKFLFIYPPSRVMDIGPAKSVSVGGHVPPLGILYLSKMLENHGYKAEVIDYNSEELNKEKLQKYVRSADVVGMSLFSGEKVQENMGIIAQIVKETDPDIPLIVGGPHCCYYPDTALIDHNADISVKREADYTIVPIAEALQGKRKLETIPGIYYREGDKIKQTKPAEQIKDLDTLPFPARHLVEKYEYGYMSGVKFSIGRTTSIMTSRGCPHKCKFCGLHYITQNYRMRSVENITQEVQEIADQGYNTLIVVDDNFLQQKKKAQEIVEYIIKNKIDIRIWIENARIDSVDRVLYEKMRDAGVESIYYGIEAGTQELLDYYNKRITLPMIREAVNLSKEMGFYANGSFILGAPIESKKHIQKTIKFAKSLPLDAVFFYDFQYLIGSPIWDEAVKEGKITPDQFIVYSDSRKNLGNFTPEELKKFLSNAFISYYVNPKLWIRVLAEAISKKDFRLIKMGLKTFLPI